MKRERLLRRPGKDKKLSFECPEVMHEEKSALHFIIIEQEAPDVGRHGPPDIWAVFLMLCSFRCSTLEYIPSFS